MATKLPDIGNLPTRLDPAVKRVLERLIEQVRELRGFTGDAAGVAGSGTGGSGTPVAGPPGPQGTPGPPGAPTPPDPPDPTPPPAPTNVTVLAGLDFVAVTTDPPAFTQGHGYGRTLVYGATYSGSGPLPTFGSAVLVDEFVGQVGSFPTEPATQWHIWVVWRSADGYDSLPQGGTNGTQVTTGQNVSNLLAVLSGQITTSQLTSALNTRINLIDAPSSTTGSVDARIATLNTTISARLNSGGDISNAIAVAQSTASAAVTTANSAASQVTTVQARLDRIQNYRVLSAGYNANAAGHAVGVFSESGASLVPVSRSYMLVVFNAVGIASSQTYDVYANGANTAGRNAATLTADLNALTDSVSILVFTHDEPLNNLTPELQTALKRCGATSATLGRMKYRGAYILAGVPGMGEGSGIERYSGEVDNDPNAFTELQLQLINGRPVGLSGGTAIPALAASVQQEISTRATVDGYLGAQYTLRLDVNGRVVGFGISNTSSGAAGSTSDFAVVTDRFSIAPPAGVSGVGSIVPFVVQATATTTAAGEILPAGVYMNAAYIRNLEVVLGRFNQAIITSAMIQSLAASKITAGSLAVGEYIQSSAYTPGGTGFRIGGDGNVDFANAGRSRVFNLGASGAQPVLKVGAALEVLANGSATFAGALAAATGTFAGSLSAATGTFAGSLTAATGSFFSSSSGKRITLNESGTNEARFYGDRGDGTVALLASIGINASGSDIVIGLFGSLDAGHSRVGVSGLSNLGVGVQGQSSLNHGVVGQSISNYGVYGFSSNSYGVVGTSGSGTLPGVTGNTAGNGPGVEGTTSNGIGVRGVSSGSGTGVIGQGTSSGTGVQGTSTSGYGGEFTGNTNRPPLRLVPSSGPPGGSAAGGLAFIPTGTVLGTVLCYNLGAGWVRVCDNQSYSSSSGDANTGGGGS